MHGLIGRSYQQIPAAIYVQGGGALGATAAGMACKIISHPGIRFVGGGGTSSGAVTIRALWNGYLHGKALGGEDMARTSAANNVKLTWQGCVRYQSGALPLWYSAGDTYFSLLPRRVRDAFHSAAREHGARNQTKPPLLDFYESLQREGNDLHAAANAGDPFLDVNVTLHRQGTNIWDARPEDEQVIRLNGLTQPRQHTAVAASGCLDFSKPIDFYGDGRLYHDGAFSSPIPDPMGAARFCHDNGVTMIILRTRPTGAHQFDDAPHRTEDWMRAYFNTKMDDAIVRIREAFPNLDLCVMEPDQVERKTANLLNPEMRFDEFGVKRRFAEGEKIAAHVMERDLGLSPVPQPPVETAERQSTGHPLVDAWFDNAEMFAQVSTTISHAYVRSMSAFMGYGQSRPALQTASQA